MPAARAKHGLRNRAHRFVLADHALVQLLLEVQELLHFALQQPETGNLRSTG